jgi:ATP-binding cassette subfamily C protein CydD
MEDVIQAATAANAHEFILDLPEGYHTQIGERGVRLSGGQIQRIALARAFLKDAPLLILDEATANLDPQSEEYIRLAIDRLLVGRTTLLIAHRLATVYQAHQIIVLEKGQVAESGSHQALLQRGGLYGRLVSAYMGTGV